MQMSVKKRLRVDVEISMELMCRNGIDSNFGGVIIPLIQRDTLKNHPLIPPKLFLKSFNLKGA
jgi:hypothetical protein